MRATPYPFEVVQPDGSRITLFLRGNEHRNYLQDPLGYAVVEAQAAGNKPMFVYATPDSQSGQLRPTQYVVGKANPGRSGLRPHLGASTSPFTSTSASGGIPSLPINNSTTSVLDPSDGRLTLFRRDADEEQISRVRRLSANGVVRNFVLMVRWANCPYTERIPGSTAPGLPTVSDLDTLFNGANSSVRDVYRVNSYGKVDIVSQFSGWITVSTSESAAAAGQSGLVCCVLHDALREALTKANAFVDFTQFDKVCLRMLHMLVTVT